MRFLAKIVHTYNALASRSRNLWFRRLGVRLNGYSWLRKVSIPRQWGDVTLQADCALDDGVVLLCSGSPKRDKVVIGQSTYINRHTMIDASESIVIGKHCMIGPFCYITDHDHGMIAGIPVNQQPLVNAPVIIEDDVWIGAHVTVLKGVRIGHGAVIGAGSVVNRNVAANAIVAGVPARQIGCRKQEPDNVRVGLKPVGGKVE